MSEVGWEEVGYRDSPWTTPRLSDERRSKIFEQSVLVTNPL